MTQLLLYGVRIINEMLHSATLLTVFVGRIHEHHVGETCHQARNRHQNEWFWPVFGTNETIGPAHSRASDRLEHTRSSVVGYNIYH